jgi:hypothetical protein
MTCHDCELALGDDQINPAIAAHLRACPACRELSEDLRANAEAFESMSLEQVPRVGQPVLPAVSSIPRLTASALAAAAAVAAIFLALPHEEHLPPPHYALAPMKFEIPAIKPAPKPIRATQPMTVKMLTDDPGVIIYWQIDTTGENQ